MGLKLRPDVPFDAQLLAKYFFRYVDKKSNSSKCLEKMNLEARKLLQLLHAYFCILVYHGIVWYVSGVCGVV